MNKLSFEYDEEKDILFIEGIKYSGNLFRELSHGLALNEMFSILERGNGTITIAKHFGEYIKEDIKQDKIKKMIFTLFLSQLKNEIDKDPDKAICMIDKYLIKLGDS